MSFAELASTISKHYEENPTHSFRCGCGELQEARVRFRKAFAEAQPTGEVAAYVYLLIVKGQTQHLAAPRKTRKPKEK